MAVKKKMKMTRLSKKPVERPTLKQQQAVSQAYRSERAGHEMVRKSPPPKRSISDIVLGAGRNIGQRIRGAVFPKAETERQKKLREAGRAAAGAAAGAGVALPAKRVAKRATRKATRSSGRR